MPHYNIFSAGSILKLREKTADYLIKFSSSVSDDVEINQQTSRIYQLLDDNTEKQLCLLESMLSFCGLSVCMSVTFMHCVQTAEDKTQFLLHTTATHLSMITVKFAVFITYQRRQLTHNIYVTKTATHEPRGVL